MFRRLIVLLLIVSMFFAFGVTAYAGSADGDSPEGTTVTTPADDAAKEAQAAFDKMLADVIKDPEAVNTEPLLVTFTKPETQTDSIYGKSYVFTGMATKSDVRVCLAKYNEETKVYEALANMDGDTAWNVIKGSAFSKEIPLTYGANKIKIVVYGTADTSSFKQEDIQVSSFTIMASKESIKSIVKNTFNIIKDEITDIFGGKK